VGLGEGIRVMFIVLLKFLVWDLLDVVGSFELGFRYL
jgi:hypothetical protein